MKKITTYKLLFKSIATIAALAYTVFAMSQQEPQYTHYMFNTMSVNPAYTGTTNSLNMLLLSRIQWVGVEGAPRSHTFTAHAPVKSKKIGVGASIITDQTGPVTNTYMNLNYAYRINLRDKGVLSLGLKGGINNYVIKLVGTELSEASNDISFENDIHKRFQPNIGTGAYLYTSKYYVGFSIPKLLQTSLKDIEQGEQDVSEIKRHYFIITGYIFDIKKDIKLKPSVLTKVVQGAPPSTDITIQALYKEKYWLGTTYRIGDAISILMNFQLNNQLLVGYSYDFTVSGMNNITNGSHEIMISYDFSGFTPDKVKSPRYF